MSHNEQPPRILSQGNEAGALLQWLEEIHGLTRECRDCRQELLPHWQLCIACDIRLATHCLACASPLPPAGASACPSCGFAVPLMVA
jgi:hypothetical protein